MDFYVYCYLDENNKPFYVGKGRRNRAYARLSLAKKIRVGSTESLCVIECRRLLKSGVLPTIIFLANDLSNLASISLEIETIAQYCRRGYEVDGILVNQTLGGEGLAGYKQTQEHIEKRVSKSRGRNHSEESKNRMRGPRLVTEKMIHAAKIRANTPEAKLRVSNQFTGNQISESQRTKISKTMKARGIKPNIEFGENHPRAQIGTVKMPNGLIVQFKSLKTFCESIGLNYSTARNTFKEKRPISRGDFKGFQVLTILSPS